uniref:Uncharacterized protein n=1 Tax=viral metagenome TaxID=1070528 RepID=A0A6M3JK24_9ZZZZ
MGDWRYKTIDKLTKEEERMLRTELNKPMTADYKRRFWQKMYHNENILNPNRKDFFWEDTEFVKAHGLKGF